MVGDVAESVGRRERSITRAPGRSASPRPGRVYTIKALRALGVSERRQGSSEFRRVGPGCYALASAPVSLRDVARVTQARIVPGGVISGPTAAELLDLPLPARMTWAAGEPVHCTVPPERKRRSARGIEIHVRAERPTATFTGLTIAQPLDVLLDLATRLAHDDLVACIDSFASLRRTALWMPVETVRIAAHGVTARGVVAVRAAARDARDAVDSPRETRTRLMLVRSGYPEPHANLPIIDPVTGRQYWIDMAYEHWRIAIEYDGKEHFDPDRARRDRYKDELLHREGWAVLRVTHTDHHDPADFYLRLDAMIADASSRILRGTRIDQTSR